MNTKRITLALATLPLRTGRVAIVAASLLCLVTLLAMAFTARPAQAQPVLLVASYDTSSGGTVGKYDAATGAAISVPFFLSPTPHNMLLDQHNHLFVAGGAASASFGAVNEYNATTGATINATFITNGLYNPECLALDGNNHLFVSNNGVTNIVGKYDATTGATINASFIQGNDPPGLYNRHGLAVDNKNHLFVTDTNANTVGEYDATTGATINATFIHQGLHDPAVLLLDGLGHLLVGDNADTATVGMYDATTGATINAAFVPGAHGGTYALALDGSNHLFVANNNGNNSGVGEYDATTGATINENFISLHSTTGAFVTGLAFVAPVPEPSTFVLAGIGFLSLFTAARRPHRRHKCVPVRTGRIAMVPASPLYLVTLLATAFAAGPAQAQPALLVSYTGGDGDTVSKYDALTGAAIQAPFFSIPDLGAHPIVIDQNNHALVSGANYVGVYDPTTGAATNPNFISGLNYPQGLALDGHNHVFTATVFTNAVSEYDATTGALINANFINPQALNGPAGMAVDNNNHLFVANSNGTTVGEFNATTGALINANFINGQGLDEPYSLALDGLNHLLVGNNNTHASVFEYDATTGAHINAFFLPGPNTVGGATALALGGSNHLFVLDISGRVGQYDATTGAAITESFVPASGSHSHYGLAYVAAVPEPSTFVLAAFGLLGLIRRRRIARTQI